MGRSKSPMAFLFLGAGAAKALWLFNFNKYFTEDNKNV